MSITMKKIDTSYWKLSEPDWVAQREVSWSKVEKMLTDCKPKKKNITPIKDYYLKGKMPNWENLRGWEDHNRHLDLFCFLWLHPSWDRELLSALRDAYMSSCLIVMEDVKVGFHNFLSSQGLYAAGEYHHINQYSSPILEEAQTELLFKIMMGGDAIGKEYTYDPVIEYGHSQIFSIPKSSIGKITTMRKWLTIDIEKWLPMNSGFLYKYSNALEWWYESSHNEPYFEDELNLKGKPNILKALYCIHTFDTEKEGDTCRTQFVHKIRKILDERDFIPEFKQMWEDVKSGKIVVENAWER